MLGRKQLLFVFLLAIWTVFVLVVYSKSRNPNCINVKNERQKGKEHFTIVSAISSNHFQQAIDMNSRNPNSTVSNVRNEHNKQGKEHFKIVSAISSNHFEQAKDMIASAQRFLPTTRIVVYDLGLKENERKELKSFCNVEVRNFDFKQYPPHFRNLFKYAWKPTLVRTVAREAEYICWADASVRFVENFEHALTMLDKFPMKGHKHPFNLKMVLVTHDSSLRYLNMTREKMQDVIGVESGLLLFKTNSLVMNLLDRSMV